MNKNECVGNIQRFLSQESFKVNSLLRGNSEGFRKAFSIISRHIEELNNECENITNYDPSVITQTINYLKGIIIEDPITQEFADFADNWCLFVFNWNNNVLKNDDLGKDTVFIQKALKQHFTIIETIDVMKRMNKKFKEINNWNPPAFEVAKHYINYLEE